MEVATKLKKQNDSNTLELIKLCVYDMWEKNLAYDNSDAIMERLKTFDPNLITEVSTPTKGSVVSQSTSSSHQKPPKGPNYSMLAVGLDSPLASKTTGMGIYSPNTNSSGSSSNMNNSIITNGNNNRSPSVSKSVSSSNGKNFPKSPSPVQLTTDVVVDCSYYYSVENMSMNMGDKNMIERLEQVASHPVLLETISALIAWSDLTNKEQGNLYTAKLFLSSRCLELLLSQTILSHGHVASNSSSSSPVLESLKMLLSIILSPGVSALVIKYVQDMYPILVAYPMISRGFLFG